MTGTGIASLAGRRERKKRATRLALRAAAVRLVAERGYAHVTVEDIAEAVDVSVRTFFNYFPDKEAAVVGDDPETMAAMREQLLALPAELSPLEALREVLLGHMQDVAEEMAELGEDHDSWIARFAALRCQPEVLAEHARKLVATEEYLAQAMLERLGGDERLAAYAALVTSSALAVARAAGMLWGRGGGSTSIVELGGAAFDLLAAGLSPDFDAPLGELSGLDRLGRNALVHAGSLPGPGPGPGPAPAPAPASPRAAEAPRVTAQRAGR